MGTKKPFTESRSSPSSLVFDLITSSNDTLYMFDIACEVYVRLLLRLLKDTG